MDAELQNKIKQFEDKLDMFLQTRADDMPASISNFMADFQKTLDTVTEQVKSNRRTSIRHFYVAIGTITLFWMATIILIARAASV